MQNFQKSMAMKNIQLQIQWLADNICNATATYQVTGPHGLLPSKERKFSDHQTLMTSYVIDFMMLHHNHPPPTYHPSQQSWRTTYVPTASAHSNTLTVYTATLELHTRITELPAPDVAIPTGGWSTYQPRDPIQCLTTAQLPTYHLHCRAPTRD